MDDSGFDTVDLGGEVVNGIHSLATDTHEATDSLCGTFRGQLIWVLEVLSEDVFELADQVIVLLMRSGSTPTRRPMWTSVVGKAF